MYDYTALSFSPQDTVAAMRPGTFGIKHVASKAVAFNPDFIILPLIMAQSCRDSHCYRVLRSVSTNI